MLFSDILNTSFYHQLHLAHILDALGWISLYYKQIGQKAWLYAANSFVDAKYPGVD